ncbi:hypothetical protein CSQ92_10055 [Janthinobacterium sp. BJB446]|uniref:hypothetical protein n=1 Tax=Janthinobacterium sp. BJB446 TaxID=2048009 RepID=UPI000C0D47CE|nr:hypothetical protein [Janthinobacterium sp. BJB446]PHV23312.1 hypothetical protein CSQ92_10055 [Janthinobacterium sp. BJB446]
MTIESPTASTELHTAISEIAAADDQLTHILDGGAAGGASSGVSIISESEVVALRERAQRQRARGVKQLSNRHDGVASILVTVSLNERSVGSAFERWFSSIENGIYVTWKRGEMFVGKAGAEVLMQMITDKVCELEADASASEKSVQQSMQMMLTDSSVLPMYTSPAAKHEVQLRTLLSNRVLSVIERNDRTLTNLVKLQWNGEVGQDEIEAQEGKVKKGLRELAGLLNRTVRAFRQRGDALAEANTGQEAGQGLIQATAIDASCSCQDSLIAPSIPLNPSSACTVVTGGR